MSQTAKVVAKQASFLMIASTVQKAIAFVAFTIAARLLGANGVGTYFYLLSISSLAAAWTDLGLTPVIVRAFSASEQEGWRLVSTAFRVKAVLIPLAALGAWAYVALVGSFDETLLPLLGIALIVMAEDAISLLGYGILRGKQRLDRESLGMVLGQLISSGALVAAVWMGFGAMGALVALAIGSLWHLVWSLGWARRLTRPPANTEPYSWSKLVRLAYPFALAGLFVRVISSVDALLIKHWQGTAAVGQYGVAYKLTYALQFLPLAFVAALYPALSAAHANEDEHGLVHTTLGSWRFMALLGFPLAASLSGFAPRLLPWLYGPEFIPAASILAILAWVLPTIFLDFPVGSYLNATHRAEQKTIAMGVAMAVNVGCNALLVRQWGGIGAAWAAVVTFICLLGLSMWFARKIFFTSTALRVLLQGTVLGALTWLLIRYGLQAFPLLISIMIAGTGIMIIAFLVGLLKGEDLRLVRRWVSKRTHIV